MSIESATNKLVLRNYPIFVWLCGGVFLGLGLFIVHDGGSPIGGVLMALVGAALVVLIPVTTVTADGPAGTIAVRRRSLVVNSMVEHSLQDVVGVDVDSQLSNSRGHTTRVYCPVLVLKTGELVPLQYGYSSGRAGKERLAQRLRDYLGLAAAESRPDLPPAVPQQAAGKAFSLQEGATDGVDWRLETILHRSGPITRWFSSAVHYPDNFLLLVQKAATAGTMPTGGILGAVWQMVYKQTLALYAFGPEDTPGLADARGIEPADPELDPYFSTLTGDPAGASRWINPSVRTTLERWTQEHPLLQPQQMSQNDPAQLVVLLSPRGLYLGGLGGTTEEVSAQLIELGVELVKAMGDNGSGW